MSLLLRLLKPNLIAVRFWIGALLSLVAGAILFQVTANAIETDAASRFRSVARIASYTIGSRIKSYTEVLRGAAGLFRSNPDTTAEQFRHYVEQLDIKKNFPGIEVINYAQFISENQRPMLEQQIRQHLRELRINRPDFAIKSRGPGGTYTVITYIEPLAPVSYEKFGMDMEWRPYTKKALENMRDTNEVAASGTRIQILSGPNRHGLAMRLPVYRPNMPIETVEQRRAAYFGTVGIGFGVQSLIEGVLETLPMQGVRLVVSDMTPVPTDPGKPFQSEILFDSAYGASPPLRAWRFWANPTQHVTLPIHFNKRTWQTDFSIPRNMLYSQFDAYYPWLAALAGAITTALLYALFQTLAASRRNALRMAQEMTKELRSSQAKLQASHEKLRRFGAHADQIKENERKRIAREIHDDLGQNLLALRIDAEMLTSRTSTHSRLHARAESTLHQIDTTIRSVRQIINDLRPTVLDLGLNAAVAWQVTDFQRRTGIPCHLIEHEAELRVDDQCATALFRIVQESLSNIARHARATEVHIELHLHDSQLSMAIHDNGRGIPPDSRNRPGSFGLVGIEERVNILDGTFSIRSQPGFGTSLMIKVPISRQPVASLPPMEEKTTSEKLTV